MWGGAFFLKKHQIQATLVMVCSQYFSKKMPQADQKIIEGCIIGRRHAQSQLYSKYAPTMLGICMRYARNKSEAHDILQDGFIKIFTNLKNFRGEGSFEGWLKRIMVNTAITHNKQSIKHQFHTDIDAIEETLLIDEDETKLENIKLPQETLINMIQNLPEGYRTVFNLYAFENLSHKEISDMLDISVNTSKSQLSKARRHLVSKITQLTGITKIGNIE